MTENKKRVLSFVFLAAFIALFMMTVAFSVGVTTSRLSAFAEININVKDSTDTTVIFSTLEPTDTVGDLKALVAASNELGAPAVEEQMLVFGGHLLADADTLQDYSIQNNSTLHLMLFSGQGTEADPYLIDTKYHLIKFRDIVNGSNGETQNTDAWAILTADIDLENQAWTPIGNDTDRYAGTFDGAGYTISGLNVNDSTLDNAGLFGVIDGGEGNGMAIKDLTLEGSIVGGTNTGSIAGTAYNFDILYCCNNAAVSGLKKVGGFIGYSHSGFSMRYCYNSAAVSATDSSVNFVGGIVGLNSVGEYEDCYNTGAVTASLASGQAGGIAGSMNSSGLIARCYNVGIVSGGDNGSSGSNSGVVLASYSPLRQTTEDNYYLENTALSSNGAVSGLTAAEFGDPESFNGWDFDTVWVISYDSVLSMSRPYLFHTYVKYHDKDGSGVVLRQPRTILGKTGILDPVIIQDLSENPAAGKAGYALVGWATTNGGAQAYTFNDYYYGAELDLYPVYSAIPAVAASITTQPSDPDLRYGYTSGSISVVATPDGGTEYALSYQWYSNTSESSVAGTEIVGATSDVYNIPTGYGTGSTHYYYCVVTATRQDNGETANTTSNPVTVTVNKAIPAYTEPSNLSGVYGEKLSTVVLPAQWAWTNPNATLYRPTSSLKTYEATFTPADTNNYEIVTLYLTVTSTKRPITVSYPSDTIRYAVYHDADVWNALGADMVSHDFYIDIANKVPSDVFQTVVNLDFVDKNGQRIYTERESIYYDMRQLEAGTFRFAIWLRDTENYYLTGNDYLEDGTVDLGENALLIVQPWTITITPNNDQGKTYGANDTTIYYSVGDAAPVLIDDASNKEEIVLNSGALSRVAGENAGDYAITLGTLALTDAAVNANYVLEIAEVDYTISPRPIYVVPNPASNTYGDGISTLSARVYTDNTKATELLVLPDDDVFTLSVSDYADAVLPNDATYSIIVSSNNENYSVTSENGAYTVNPRPITVTYTATCVYEATYLDMDSWVALGTTMGENDYFFVVSNQVNTDPLFYDPTSGQDNGILNLDYYNAEADFYLWDRDDIDYALYLCEAGTYDFVVSLHNNNYVLESPIVLGQYAKIIINPWIITITPDGGQGKTYGENDTVITYSVSEAAPGEEIVLNGGALSYSGGSNAGDHPITLGSLALTNDPVNANYELEIADVKYTIGKRTLSLININEEPVRFTYDENPMYLLHQFLTWGGEHFKADGQVGSLFAIVDGSVAEADDFIEAFTVLPYREESEGRVYLTDLIFSESYANEIVTGIWQFEFREEGNNNNYSLTTSFDNNFKGNILQKPIYFTPDDAEKEYGQEDGAIALIDAYKYMYAGLNPYGPFVETVINSDDDDFYDDLLYDNLFDLSTSIGLSFSREEGENVGTYTINDLSCSSFGSGFSANYGAAMGALATFTINKAAATIAVAPSAKAGLVYDGTYQELVTAGSGVVGGTLKYRVGDGMWTTDLPAERNATSSESGYTVYYKVEPDGNHTGDIQGTLENITIAKRPITVRYTSGHKYVTYKDEASWAVLSEEMSPPNDLHLVIDNMAQENDGIFAVLYIDFLDENGLFVYEDRHMYDMFNLEAGAYEMVATLSNSNYELAEPIDVSAFRLFILPRVITVTPDENQGKIYGDNDTTITYTVDYGNVLLGDEVALNDGALSYSGGSDAGDHPITLGNLALTDDAVNANYELVLSETPVLYTIAPKSIAGAEITLGTALTYNGNAQTQTVSSVALDDFDLTYTVTGNIGTNAGEYILTVSGTGNFTGSETKAWSIGKKSISGAVITLGNALIYNGDEQTQEVVSVVVDDSSATYTVTENTGTDAGNYTLTVTGTGNYTGTATKEFGIGKKALTITANDKVVTYGDAPANGGVTYAGFVTGQDETILTGTLAYAFSYEQFGRAGEYDITVSGLTGDNYAITYVAGTLRVNKKAVEIGISPVVAIEGNVPDPATTITGLLNGDTATVIVRYSLGETVLTEKPTTAGAYVATAILAEANYVAESKQANFVVKATVVEAPVEDTEEDTPVSISSDDGFDPNAELVVRKLWSGEQEYKAVSDYVATNERIAGVYDVKLLLGGTPVHIDEPVTVRMRIPETMIGKEFSLVNLSGSVAERIDYTVEGNYVVITTSTLDQFAFVYAEGDGAFTPDLTWLYILLGVLGGCLLIAAIIIFVFLKKKKDEEKKKALERKAEE